MRFPRVLAAAVAILLAGSSLAAVRIAGRTDRTRSAQRAVVLAAGVQNVAGFAAATEDPPALGPASTLPVPAGPTKASAPAKPTSAPDSGRPSSLPTPTVASLPQVAPLRSLREVDALVMLPSTLSGVEASRLRALRGVAAAEPVDTGTVTVAGARAVAFGVDPSTFRAFTPQASASSSRLWQYLAAGALVSSYEMASDRGLKLGSRLPVEPAGAGGGALPGWLGAFASIGLPGVDLLVSHADASLLGLTPESGLVVSAPGVAGAQLRQELEGALPGGAVELLRPDQMTGLISGDTLSTAQRAQMIAAALSRVGDPYVWGAAGSSSFDCSGLVQWSFAQAGIRMPRTADEQFLTGVHIPLSVASPGDLLFWTYDPNDPGFVDHTAIYLGNGMMVVAPHTGLDVQVVPVPTNDFAGAVDVLLQPA